MRRIVVVAQRREVGKYLARGFPVGADERESQVAAHHLAVIDIENSTARPMHRFHFDFVEPLQHRLSGLVVPLYAPAGHFHGYEWIAADVSVGGEPQVLKSLSDFDFAELGLAPRTHRGGTSRLSR
jgi:hypothetical protein